MPQVTRRDLLVTGAATGIGLTGFGVGPTVAAAQEESLSATGAGEMNREGAPEEILVAEGTSMVFNGVSKLPSDDTLTVDFMIKPLWGSSESETVGSTAIAVSSVSGDSVEITANDLFDGGALDLLGPNGHSAVTPDVFSAPIEGVDPPYAVCAKFRATVRVDSAVQGTLGALSDKFEVIFALDAGFGYNLGANLGRRYPDFSNPDHVEVLGGDTMSQIETGPQEDGVDQFKQLMQ